MSRIGGGEREGEKCLDLVVWWHYILLCYRWLKVFATNGSPIEHERKPFERWWCRPAIFLFTAEFLLLYYTGKVVESGRVKDICHDWLHNSILGAKVNHVSIINERSPACIYNSRCVTVCQEEIVVHMDTHFNNNNNNGVNRFTRISSLTAAPMRRGVFIDIPLTARTAWHYLALPAHHHYNNISSSFVVQIDYTIFFTGPPFFFFIIVNAKSFLKY